MQRVIYLLSMFMLVVVLQAYAEEPVVVLKPHMRVEPKTSAINTVDTEALSSYFENIAIFDTPEEFTKLPYIIAFDNDATMGASNDIAYSRGLNPKDQISAYTMLSPGKKFVDKDTKEVLGFYADAIGNTEVIRWGDVQTLKIINSLTPVDPGIKLVPRIGLDLPAVIEVRLPAKPVVGRVLQVDNDIIGVGHYAVAIISIGARDGAQRGDLLDIVEAPKSVRDVVKHKNVMLPTETFGKVLIYKTFEKVSLAIVTEADKPMVIGDEIRGGPENTLAGDYPVKQKKPRCFCLKCLFDACKTAVR